MISVIELTKPSTRELAQQIYDVAIKLATFQQISKLGFSLTIECV